MAYQVDRFNGTFFVSVADGTIDTTSDLRLVGKNYAGYGELQNENFLHLLENFSNTTPPPKAIVGQIWYDSGNKKLKFYDGNKFRTAGGAEVGPTAPSGLQTGEFWFDTASEQLYAWNGAEFVLIGPETPPDLGASAFSVVSVFDVNSGEHLIAKLTISGVTIGTLSKDDFRLRSTPESTIPGFDRIRKGFTLINTLEGNNGVTSDDHYYWGTASAARGIVGATGNLLTYSDLVLQSQLGSFPDNGFYVGDQTDLRVWIESGQDPIIESTSDLPIIIRINNSSNERKDVAVFSKTAVSPGLDNIYDLGSLTSRWKSVYSSSFLGNLTGSVTGNTTGIHTGNLLAADTSLAYDASNKTFFGTIGSPSNLSVVYGNLIGNASNSTNSQGLNGLVGEVGAVPTSVVLRDSSANITASRFIGTTDSADRIRINNSAIDSDPNYKTAKTTATPDSIAARDSSGNLIANIFQGTATAARYADLAEKYLTDKEYTVGTVVVVGGEKEVTESSTSQRAIGVVSESPAFMMNKDLENGTYIALKGRVPVRISGKVKKGDRLVAHNNGTAVAVTSENPEVFAIALESKDSVDIGLIEAVIL